MKFVFFLKSRLIFKIFYCFCMFVYKYFINTGGWYVSKSKRYYNAKPSAYYFYMRMKTPLDFGICISVPLRYLNFCLNFFGHVRKRLDKKAKVNLISITKRK